ncbi:MAG: universal stress protein [Halolamina sp.]
MSILVAVAHDHTRNRVLEFAAGVANERDQELRVIHFVDDDPDDQQRLREVVHDHAVEVGIAATVDVEQVPRESRRTGKAVGEGILEAAGDAEAEQIVLGHSSGGLLERVTDGSTALEVVGSADVPVTVVPEPPEPTGSTAA